jgi:hypothetical protein
LLFAACHGRPKRWL